MDELMIGEIEETEETPLSDPEETEGSEDQEEAVISSDGEEFAEEAQEGSSEEKETSEETEKGSSEEKETSEDTEETEESGTSVIISFADPSGESPVVSSDDGGVVITFDPSGLYDFSGIEAALSEIRENQLLSLEEERQLSDLEQQLSDLGLQLEEVAENQTLALESMERQELQNEACVSVLLIFCVVGMLTYIYKFFGFFFPNR